MNLLAEHTTTTAAEAIESAEVALLPTGSTEQHGPALPLGTDFMAAEAVARGIDREDVLVLPTVPVGVSEHHWQFDGTLWVSPETFEQYVEETLGGLSTHGLRKAVVVNGHGGNTDAIQRAARSLRDTEAAFVAPWNWWAPLEDLEDELFEGEGGHAGPLETSMLLHVAPDLVDEDALDAAEAGAADRWGIDHHGATIGFDTADFSESGAVGTPTEASREAGERLYEAATAELDALVDWLADQAFRDLLPEPHR